jgi:hypothetical protein
MKKAAKSEYETLLASLTVSRSPGSSAIYSSTPPMLNSFWRSA